MSTMQEDRYPCHIHAAKQTHPEHDWSPLIPDPIHPNVMHDSGVTLRCPGYDPSDEE